ncbi:MAG: adenylosuccinate lyase [Bacteroidales bacterium]
MRISELDAISPVDGRYQSKTRVLQEYFSEKALIYYRLNTEVQYFKALCQLPLPQLEGVREEQLIQLDEKLDAFSAEDAEAVKSIEKTTNHDVKAVEYHVKSWFDQTGLSDYKEFVHFGLTSQDINNTAIPLSIKKAYEDQYLPHLRAVIEKLDEKAEDWSDVAMLARTHGQPASPTRLGKELDVFAQRLREQVNLMKSIPFAAKFGGATGNFNAHYVAFPRIDWHQFGKDFVENYLDMKRSFPTTQIEHYDHMAAFFDGMKRINTILTDFCRDIWSYISMDYFKQQIKAGEVGSSAMPHKVNPIDFENAEGNLGMSSAIAAHLSIKLPVSRLQRDLTDSTVTRNLGLPFAYSLIAFQAIIKGLDKLLLNQEKINDDLEQNWAVVAEAIQNIMRREAYPKPYEALKNLTRTNEKVTKERIHTFIDSLELPEEVKKEMKEVTPFNYLGC